MSWKDIFCRHLKLKSVQQRKDLMSTIIKWVIADYFLIFDLYVFHDVVQSILLFSKNIMECMKFL